MGSVRKGGEIADTQRKAWRRAALSVGASLVLALAAIPAQAFTPFPVEQGASEHRRISEAALGCAAGPARSCWSVDALDRLEVAIRRPDITWITLKEAAHCDGGDLPGEGAAALAACKAWMFDSLELAVKAADGLVDATGRPVGDARGCAWRVLRPRTALCEVDFHLGRALHAAQDFYSHTNWVDAPVPASEVSLENPQGLGGAGPIPWLASDSSEPPPGLISGCFVFIPERFFCHGRTRHADLNKDHRPSPKESGTAPPPRNAAGGNFPRAFEAAVGETDRFWKRFEARLVAAYGERRGRAMSCRLRGLPPSMCGRGES